MNDATVPEEWIDEVLHDHITDIVFEASASIDPECVLCQKAAVKGFWDRHFDLSEPGDAQLLATLKARGKALP